MVENEREFTINALTWSSFEEQLNALAPGMDFEPHTPLAAIPVYQRIRILRWVSDYFESPTPLSQVEQFETLGEIRDWMQNVLIAGERPRSQLPQSRGHGESTRVRLRPILERDIMPLYLASLDPSNSSRWRYRGRTVPLDEFVGTLYAGVVSQYMVEMTTTGDTVGIVTAYDENRSGLNCKIAYLRCGDRSHGDSAAVFEGMLLFISFLFKNFPFRKLFAEVPAYNMELFADDFAEHEGTLKEYLFHDGAFVDLHYVSISRDRWNDLADRTGW